MTSSTIDSCQRAVGLALEQRQQRAKCLARVADEVQLHRIADADHPGVEIDLDAARLTLLRQELGVREARSDHQQRVAAAHQLPARPAPEQADRAGHVGHVVGDDGASEQCLGDPRAERLRGLQELGVGSERAPTGEDRHALAFVQDLGGPPQVGRRGNRQRPHVPGRGVHGPVLVRWLRGLQRREVVRDDQTGDRLLRKRDADRAVDEVPHLLGDGRHLNVLGGDVLEQRDEVDFLLVAAAERGAGLLADDREDGRVVELCVVQAVEEMDRARPGGGEADTDLAGELGVSARHQRSHLLVAHLDQLGVAVCAVEGADDRVDAVAWIAEDAVNAPCAEPLEQEVRDELGQLRSPWGWSTVRTSRS